MARRYYAIILSLWKCVKNSKYLNIQLNPDDVNYKQVAQDVFADESLNANLIFTKSNFWHLPEMILCLEKIKTSFKLCDYFDWKGKISIFKVYNVIIKILKMLYGENSMQ